MIGFAVMSVLMMLLAARVLPERWVPSGVAAQVVAVVASILVLWAARDAGLLRRLHDDLSEVGGEFDEASTWIVALAAALTGVVVVDRLRRMRALRRSGSTT